VCAQVVLLLQRIALHRQQRGPELSASALPHLQHGAEIAAAASPIDPAAAKSHTPRAQGRGAPIGEANALHGAAGQSVALGVLGSADQQPPATEQVPHLATTLEQGLRVRQRRDR
jgi:hypothetical protein